MKLEEIGFYTLSDNRAKTATFSSVLQRCELILTDRCNFKCAYCRGIKNELRGDLTLDEAKHVVDLWVDGGLRNIRFSGGEPTLWPHLEELVIYTKSRSTIQRIALSTNGSAPLYFYKRLYFCGIDDFSISLDACCAMTADRMAGTDARFEHICEVIRELSKITYCTVGVVVDNRNEKELASIINYATGLGVSDIRIIPSAQYNRRLNVDVKTEYKILQYRLENLRNGRHVRGIQDHDCTKCHLVKDDMAILHGKHFPCIIYMREQGEPCGSIEGKTIQEIREDRRKWFERVNVHEDPICKRNCLDVCIDYNNKFK